MYPQVPVHLRNLRLQRTSVRILPQVHRYGLHPSFGNLLLAYHRLPLKSQEVTLIIDMSSIYGFCSCLSVPVLHTRLHFIRNFGTTQPATFLVTYLRPRESLRKSFKCYAETAENGTPLTLARRHDHRLPCHLEDSNWDQSTTHTNRSAVGRSTRIRRPCRWTPYKY